MDASSVEFFAPDPQVMRPFTEAAERLKQDEDDDEALKGHYKQSRFVRAAVQLDNARLALERGMQLPSVQRWTAHGLKVALCLTLVFFVLVMRWSHIVERTDVWATVVTQGECKLPPEQRVRDINARCEEAVQYQQRGTLERYSQAMLEDAQSLFAWAQTWTGLLSIIVLIAIGTAAALAYLAVMRSGALSNWGLYLNSVVPGPLKGGGSLAV